MDCVRPIQCLAFYYLLAIHDTFMKLCVGSLYLGFNKELEYMTNLIFSISRKNKMKIYSVLGKPSKKKTIFFVTNVTLWGGGFGAGPCHKKNHSFKIIFEQF